MYLKVTTQERKGKENSGLQVEECAHLTRDVLIYRLLWEQGVGGSNPLAPTIDFNGLEQF